MTELLFAFGSNMCSGRLLDYEVSIIGKGRAALLRGYRLQFNKKSTLDSSGKANISLDEGSEVWGVLYGIPDSDLPKLDKGEGGYKRLQMTVLTEDGETIPAWLYVAKKPSTDPTLLPYTWYKRFLVEGAREHSLPERYVNELQEIRALQDPDLKREEKQQALLCYR